MVAKTAKNTGDKGPIGYQAAVRQIDGGEIKPVYLLYGDETFLQERFIRHLKEAWLGEEADGLATDREDGRGMTQAQAVDLAGQMMLFAGRKLVVIDDPAFIPLGTEQGKGKGDGAAGDESAEDQENEAASDGGASESGTTKGAGKYRSAAPAEQPLVAYLTQPAAGSCLVLRCRKGKPDRRHKVVAEIAVKGGLVETPLLDPKGRIPYLQEALRDAGKRCPPGLLEQIARQPGDLAFSLLELDKIIAYAGGEEALTAEMADEILTPGLESNIFRLVDALGQRRRSKALGELRALLDNGEAPFAIFAMMLRQFRLIFRAKACLQEGMGRGRIAQALNVQPFIAENAAAQSKYYTFAELENAMALFCDGDLAMKSGPAYRQVLEDLVIQLGG